MFSNKNVCIQWLLKNSAIQLVTQLNSLDEEDTTTLYNIYTNALDVQGNYGVIHITSKLGEAIASLIQLAALSNTIVTGTDKKVFVMENVINLSRLLDNGIDGTEDNINKEVEGFVFLGDTPTSFQETFILPMADNAIESLWND